MTNPMKVTAPKKHDTGKAHFALVSHFEPRR